MASLSNLAIGRLRAAGLTNLAHARRAGAALFNHATSSAIERMLP